MENLIWPQEYLSPHIPLMRFYKGIFCMIFNYEDSPLEDNDMQRIKLEDRPQIMPAYIETLVLHGTPATNDLQRLISSEQLNELALLWKAKCSTLEKKKFTAKVLSTHTGQDFVGTNKLSTRKVNIKMALTIKVEFSHVEVRYSNNVEEVQIILQPKYLQLKSTKNVTNILRKLHP